MAPGCLGAKGTSLSESIVLLRLFLGTAQVAVEALDSCQFGEEGTSVPQLGAPCSLCSSYSHVPRYGAGSCREIKDEFSWSLSTATVSGLQVKGGIGQFLSFCHHGKGQTPVCGLTRICTYYKKI